MRTFPLARAATDYLRDCWDISRARWIAEYYPDGQWGGDRCGCPDDRCIGFHGDHEPGECPCVEYLAGQIAHLSTVQVGG